MGLLMDLLMDSLLIAGIVLVLVSLVTGLVFLLAPNRALGAERQADRHFSLRRMLKPLEIPRETERFFYRHHRIAGAGIVVLALAFLWLYLVAGEGGRITAWAGQRVGGDLLAAWAAGLGGLLVVLNIAALLFGTVMFVRPSALKQLEALGNRWISTRRMSRSLENEHDPLGRFAGRHPRLFGVLVLIGSFFIVVNLVFMLR
jgi:hypothetical protein